MREDKNRIPETGAADETEKKELNETWAADSLDELEDWIEEQGIQLRY